MKIVSVTSGKGGVGKTSLTSNIALGLSQLNQKVLILDGDLGMANIDIFFGIHPQKTLLNLIQGESFSECVTKVTQNIHLLAGGSGLYQLCHMNAFERREVLARIEDVQFSYDYMLIDTSPGLHDHVLHLNSVAQECMIVLTSDPSSVADSYALIKVLHQKYRTKEFSIICNQMRDEKQGEQLFLRFADVVQQFLPVRLHYKKTIQYDPAMKLANQHQRLILRQDPQSVSSTAIKALCSEIVSQNQIDQSRQPSVKGLDALFGPASGHA